MRKRYFLANLQTFLAAALALFAVSCADNDLQDDSDNGDKSTTLPHAPMLLTECHSVTSHQRAFVAHLQPILRRVGLTMQEQRIMVSFIPPYFGRGINLSGDSLPYIL